MEEKKRKEDEAPVQDSLRALITGDIKKAYDMIDRYIMIIDRDFRIEFCNRKIKDEIGIIEGKPWYTAFFSDSTAEEPEECPREEIERSHFRASRVMKCRDRYVYFAVQPFAADASGVAMAVVIWHDVTEMVEVAQKEKEARKMMETMFNSISDPITVHAPDYTIINANTAALNLLSLRKEEVIGKHCYELFHSTKAPIPDCPMKRTLFKEDMETSQIGRPYLNGDYLVSTMPVFNDDGELIRILHSIKDISELKNMERRLIRDKERLMMFSDLISHDVRNYSQGALLATEMLLSDKELTSRQKRYLRMIETQIRSAQKLMETANKLSRLSEEKINPYPVDAGVVLIKVISQLKKTYAGKKIEINTDVRMGTHTVMADELLFDVFINLMGNAIKYTPSEPARVDVQAKVLSDDPSFYRFEIIDRAGGIPDDQKETIFDRFKRGEKTVSGTGLGLTLAKKIVEGYGGKIWVEDFTEGDEVVGSSFVILLKKG